MTGFEEIEFLIESDIIITMKKYRYAYSVQPFYEILLKIVTRLV